MTQRGKKNYGTRYKPGITKTRLFKYIENFTTKNWKFSDKTSDISFSYVCSKHLLWVALGTY